MADNLLDMMKGQLGGVVMDQMCKQLGLGADKGKDVIEKSAATMLSGLALKSQQPGGAGDIIDMLSKNNIDGSLLDNLGDVLGNPQKTEEVTRKGGGLLEGIFGSKLTGILSLLGGMFGLGTGLMGKVMGMIAPLVLSQVAKVVFSKNMGASGLTDLLKGQLPFLKQSAPAGLGNILGFADLGQQAAAATGAAVRAGQATVKTGYEAAGNAARTGQTVAKETAGGFGKILPWIIGAALALAGLFALRSCNQPVEVEPVAPAIENAAPVVPGEPGVEVIEEVEAMPVATEPLAVVAAEPKIVTLPGDVEIELPTGGVLDQFVSMLSSTNPDMTKTFAIDAIDFASGAADPTIKNADFFPILAKILQAYKGVNLKLTGYTGEAGTDEEEMTLSTSMAESIKKVMTGLGIDADRITVEGAGYTKPVAPDEDALNRRVEFGVTKI